MFNNLFDFGKKRSLKESIGFFLFHGSIAFCVMTFLKALG